MIPTPSATPLPAVPANNPASPAANLILRDLHLPETVSQWPLAPGWWLLGILILLLLAAAVLGQRYYRQHIRPLRSSRAASIEQVQQHLQQWQAQQDHSWLVNQLNRELKCFCKRWYPHAVNLHGEHWIAFLRQHSQMDTGHLQPLASAGYTRPPAGLDGVQLGQAVCQWLQQQNRARLQKSVSVTATTETPT